MTKRLHPNVVAIRKAIRVLRKGWTKGFYAKNKVGDNISPTSRYAICWCLIGAFKKIGRENVIDDACPDMLHKAGFEASLVAANDMANSVDEVISKLQHWADLY